MVLFDSNVFRYCPDTWILHVAASVQLRKKNFPMSLAFFSPHILGKVTFSRQSCLYWFIPHLGLYRVGIIF